MMETLQLKRNTRLNEIKNAFNEKFSMLKLEFFKKSHGESEGSRAELMITSDEDLESIGFAKDEAVINFDEATKVSDLEQSFEKVGGLHVQVFRKSGSVWLETIGSDSWTLAEQQNHAIERL